MTGSGPSRTDADWTHGVEADGVSTWELLSPVTKNLRLVIAVPVLCGLLAFGATYLFRPTFTARTTFLSPQQQQSAAAATLNQLGALAGLAGGAAGVKSQADQYVSLMQSVTVSDRIIDQFKLMIAYDARLRLEARQELASNVKISVGKKDSLITVEVDDYDAQRAADIANQYVSELRRVTSELALTEAKQRRAFFEDQLKKTREQLALAQQALQTSGFNPGAMKAEPKAAAETFARLEAQVTASEVRLRTMRRSLADGAPEIQQQQAQLSALRDQLAKVEISQRTSMPAEGSDYIGKFRDYKYQETLFDLFSRQFELARVDESRDGGLIQVLDAAQIPERKSKPKRLVASLIAAGVALVLVVLVVVVRGAQARMPGARA